ncbi:MAG: hypothetical protein US80_C0013G0002 [Candidatus Daviesbacteria bacterium GW2011_GWA2_38_17]|uniref:Antitoxin n=1 Tax=Candidatus Daviesbacteria bacterium GW2011_GWF2_38_6 TaxID=1618432 RepID=A0A0G0KFX6_9BACT|nr:MAG: hypothetical protein US80_C0013G0002 [Candidatus Daviesbacteria bacterium GW2011_GWA2_38_17]KKQ77657.1 MAG: hypothetical protein US99_C0036G0002 [Candidatus Daviesbacteria bacterium GW2011_GWF2_38_6]
MYMQYITTTELRTQSSELVEILKQGGSVSLIHRSKVIGKIEPAQKNPIAITDIKAFRKALAEIQPKKLIPRKDRDRVYRQRLMEKYG